MAAQGCVTVYYIRHGETEWNATGRLQGRHDVPLNARGREQAAHCGSVLRDLFAREGRAAADFDYVSSPLVRASETLELAREAMGLRRDGYTTDERLAEIAFGDWEGCTLAQLQTRDPQRLAAREHDKFRFEPPNGESYEMVMKRMGEWYDGLTHDTVAAAHGGTARALIAHLAIAHQNAAPLVDIAQGVVYVFARGSMTRYA
jgi:probable phosphoglycerate mutase